MTRTELARALAERADLSRADAARVLDALFSPDGGILPDALRRGASVAIRGFGTFEVRARAPRLARHPETGRPIQIGATRRPAWRPSRRLTELVEG